MQEIPETKSVTLTPSIDGVVCNLSMEDPRVYDLIFMPNDKSPYFGGTFFAKCTFPTRYPHYPSRIKITTKIFHPNVSRDGEVHVKQLCGYGNFSNFLELSDLLEFLNNLFYEPVYDSGSICNYEAGRLYKEDKEAFSKIVNKWVRKYAS